MLFARQTALGPAHLQPADGRGGESRRLLPSRAVSASLKSPVEIPFKYNHGNSSSWVLVRRKVRGRMAEVNVITLARSRTRDACLACRRAWSGLSAWVGRLCTTRWWPCASLNDLCCARNACTSATTAVVSICLAPLHRAQR